MIEASLETINSNVTGTMNVASTSTQRLSLEQAEHYRKPKPYDLDQKRLEEYLILWLKIVLPEKYAELVWQGKEDDFDFIHPAHMCAVEAVSVIPEILKDITKFGQNVKKYVEGIKKEEPELDVLWKKNGLKVTRREATLYFQNLPPLQKSECIDIIKRNVVEKTKKLRRRIDELGQIYQRFELIMGVYESRAFNTEEDVQFIQELINESEGFSCIILKTVDKMFFVEATHIEVVDCNQFFDDKHHVNCRESLT